jgi:hypothetical protein
MRKAFVLVGLCATIGACSDAGQRNAVAIASADHVVAGAVPPDTTAAGQTGLTGGPRVYNSENRPKGTRTGLNSDPDTPSGQ